MKVNFELSERFASFQDFIIKLEAFKESNFVELWIRNSRTVEAAQKRIKCTLNPSLTYYEIKYSCVHGGKRFSSRSKGHRSLEQVSIVLVCTFVDLASRLEFSECRFCIFTGFVRNWTGRALKKKQKKTREYFESCSNL